jgi:hypothetical protein
MSRRSLSDISPVVRTLAAKFVDDVTHAALAVLAEILPLRLKNVSAGHASSIRRRSALGAQVNAVDTALLKRYEAQLTQHRDMQCKHIDDDGKRCEERSRGPRFHYLCKTHEAVREKN